MDLSGRIGTWWMNPRLADVHFNVGPPDGVQELIPAHILVVAPASDVFNAMLLGSFDVPPTIDVPDGDPDAFKEMLRYIYTDSKVVTVGNASGLLYLAKKYLLSGLIEQVVDHLKANIGNNFAAIYRESWLHEEMRDICADFMANYPNDLFLYDDFVELSFDDMRKVAVKSLAVDTPTFYRQMRGWAQAVCQCQSVEVSTSNMRRVLADAFKLISFVTLSPEEFEQGPGNDELLTVHEKAVLRHWYKHGDFRLLVGQKPVTTFHSFATGPEFLQGSEGVCTITERQAVENVIANSPTTFGAMQVFSVEFETDKCIFFSGVVCSFRAHEVKFSLGVDGRTLAASKRLGFACQRSFAFGGRVEEAYDWSSAALKVDSPVLIQAHRKYKLSVTANLAVGTETRRVAQIAGREAKQPSGTPDLLRNEEKGTQHKTEPAHFTLTYGEARCTFAEILYRNVDDTIYCV